MIPYSRQLIEEDDIDAVVSILRSDWISQGPAIAAFEREVAQYCGARYAVALSSATAGLHLACLAMDVGPGKRVWTSPNTFVATANCARHCGADVDFVDIDPRTYCISIQALAEKLAWADDHGLLPDVVIAVDFAGQPCDWQSLAELRDAYGFRLIEDAAHAFGAQYKGARIGGTGFADCTVFSFHPVKIMTTGEGGMVVTDDALIHQRISALRSHGITRDRAVLTRQDEGAWYYEQQSLGFNYRMTDIDAALGSSQLKKVERFLARRRELATRYERLLQDLPVQTPWQSPDGRSSFHIYPVLLPDEHVRRQAFDALREQDIFTQVHFIPVHLHPDYLAQGFSVGQFPQAEAYYKRTLSLPLHPVLTDAAQQFIVDLLSDVLAKASLEASEPAQ